MTDNSSSGDVDRQISKLTEIVRALATTVSQISGRIDRLEKASGSHGQVSDGEDQDNDAPAVWVWFDPPASVEDHPDTVENFVAWYNVTYVGIEGSRARPIPDCWSQHPGLAMEVASLAYSWRAANIGPSASPREAQYWHHQWRPGFTERLAREWIHADCIDGEHRATGAPEREDRFTAVKARQRPEAEAPIG